MNGGKVMIYLGCGLGLNASTEPPFVNGGKPQPRSLRPAASPASTEPPFVNGGKRPCRPYPRRPWRCFNGAPVRERGKAPETGARAWAGGMLQRSPRSCTGESCRDLTVEAVQVHASTEPQFMNGGKLLPRGLRLQREHASTEPPFMNGGKVAAG